MLKKNQGTSQSIKLVGLDNYFDEMINLYESGRFPKVLLLNGKKGIGKFTLIFHFLNYIYSKKEKTSYNLSDKLINIDSKFYNSVLNNTTNEIIFIQAEEGENIKIEVIRNLKSLLSKTSLSNNKRFIIIDDVEFLNANSANALLKSLEEPSEDNYFILINNQQADLIETIKSRCIINNIYLNLDLQQKVIDYLTTNNKIDFISDNTKTLTPGLLSKYTKLINKYKVNISDNVMIKLNNLLHAYKKDKNKALIGLSIYLIDQYFYNLIKENENKIDFLMNLKLNINNKINDFIVYNLNINSVLNTIELNLKNVRE